MALHQRRPDFGVLQSRMHVRRPRAELMLRCTRLADLVNTMDPKLVAAAFCVNPEGVMIYLADHIDDGRLPAQHGS